MLSSFALSTSGYLRDTHLECYLRFISGITATVFPQSERSFSFSENCELFVALQVIFSDIRTVSPQCILQGSQELSARGVFPWPFFFLFLFLFSFSFLSLPGGLRTVLFRIFLFPSHDPPFLSQLGFCHCFLK